MTKADSTHPGGCLCGAIRYVATGEPLWVAHCHCQSCRRSTGAPFATFVGFAPDQVAFSASAPATYASSPGVRRSFCGDCGTPIAFEADRYPGEIHLYVCTMDAPAEFTPQAHVHVREQLPWLHLDGGLPRFRASGETTP
ncbi:MAG: GFA family protein [Alphaproteobacteria bacterium]